MKKKHYLFKIIRHYIAKDTELKFQEFESKETGIKIEHNTPEPSKVTLSSKLTFKDSSTSKSHISMNLGGYETEMTYVGDFDMYIGYREIGKKQYQILIQILDFGEKNLIEISYHDLNEPTGNAVGHDGTIHPHN